MMRTSTSMEPPRRSGHHAARRARARGLEMSGQLGPLDEVAEPGVGAEALEVVVAPEHSLGVKSGTDRLAEPLEGAIDVTLPRFGAGEVVERRRLAIAELESVREVLRRLRFLAGIEARVTGVEERPAGILVPARVGLEGLRGLLPGLDVGPAQRAADAEAWHGEGVLHLRDLVELRVVVEGGEVGVVAEQLGIVEAAFHRPLQLDQRGLVVAL